VSVVQHYAASLLGDSEQYTCFANIIERESGWRVHAGNSDGSYGIPQALPGNKMESEGSDWADNPMTQVRWAVKYMRSRYGSACSAWDFWQGHSWY
jgi:Transglycosylase SLT domain